MAKHILEGEFPLFFYGQYYLGPLEALVTAFFFIIFGIKMHVIYFSVLFFSALFIISTYFFAKIFEDKLTGLIAMAYAAFPPAYFFSESVTPAGYHIELPLLGTLLFITALYAVKAEGAFKKAFLYILMGLIAGIGFWTHYLFLYFITSAALFLTIKEKVLVLFRNGILTVISAMLASLPFWIFTFQNKYCTFKFNYDTINQSTNISAVSKTYLQIIISMLGLSKWSTSKLQLFLAIVYALMFLYFIVLIVTKKERFNSGGLLLVIFVVFVSCIYIFYRAHSVGGWAWWYLNPLISFIPVCFGSFIGRLLRFNVVVGILTGLLFVSVNLLNISKEIKHDKELSEMNKKSNVEKIRSLDEKHIYRLIGEDRLLREIEFYSKEKIIGTGLHEGDYFPHEDKIEASDKAAFESVDPVWVSVLNNICKSYKSECGIYYDLMPFPYVKQSIRPNNWNAVSNAGILFGNRAFDRNYDSYWQTVKGKRAGDYFQIDMGRIYKVCSLRMLNLEGPSGLTVELSEDGFNWREAAVITDVGPLFWCGPRVYWKSVYGRLEYFFEPQDARYIKLVNMRSGDKNTWGIQEIFVYEYLGEIPYSAKEYVKEIKDVYMFLKKHKVSFVYADYWPSARIRKLSNGLTGAVVSFNTWRPLRKDMDRKVSLSKEKAILIDMEDFKEVENIFNEFCISYKKKIFNRYICYLFPDLEGNKNDTPSFFWCGFDILKYSLKDYSEIFYGKGNYERALRYYPNNYLAYLKLRNLPRSKFYPEVDSNIDFINGIRFLGYSIRSNRLKSGKTVRIEYFWEIEKGVKDELSVFIYFMKDGKIVFQNDHAFLYQFPRPLEPLEGERFREALKLKIPVDVQPGEYKIVIGLWDENQRKRVGIKDLHDKRCTKKEIGKLTILP